MGMSSAARQQPAQQPAQLGGGKGQPTAVKPMQPQPMQPQLGGGKGVAGQSQQLPAYAQPYAQAMLPQQPMRPIEPPQQGGFMNNPQAAGMQNDVQSYLNALPAKQQLDQMNSGFNQNNQPTPEQIQQMEGLAAQIRNDPGFMQRQQPYEQFARDMYNEKMRTTGYVGGATRPTFEQYLNTQQLAPGAVAPTQAEIERLRPMQSTPSNIPLQTVPQLSPQQVMQANRLAPQPVSMGQVGTPAATMGSLSPQRPVQQPLQIGSGGIGNQYTKSQPVVKEDPRQVAQRAMQLMAASKRGMR